MGIFQCYLCLTHAAQPVDGAGQNDGGTVSIQFAVESFQDAPAPREVGVPVRNVPDPRNHGGGADGVRISPSAQGSVLPGPLHNQLAEGMEHLEFQVVPRGKGTDDQACVPQLLPELLDPGAAGVTKTWRAGHLIQEEDQPRQPGQTRLPEFQFRIGHVLTGHN